MTMRQFVTAVLLLNMAVAVPVLGADETTEKDRARARAAAARRVYEDMWQQAMAPVSPEMAYRWSKRWMQSEQEGTDKKEDRTAAAKSHLERMQKAEEYFKRLFAIGSVTRSEVAASEFFRLKAEQAVNQANGR